MKVCFVLHLEWSIEISLFESNLSNKKIDVWLSFEVSYDIDFQLAQDLLVSKMAEFQQATSLRPLTLIAISCQAMQNYSTQKGQDGALQNKTRISFFKSIWALCLRSVASQHRDTRHIVIGWRHIRLSTWTMTTLGRSIPYLVVLRYVEFCISNGYDSSLMSLCCVLWLLRSILLTDVPNLSRHLVSLTMQMLLVYAAKIVGSLSNLHPLEFLAHFQTILWMTVFHLNENCLFLSRRSGPILTQDRSLLIGWTPD